MAVYIVDENVAVCGGLKVTTIGLVADGADTTAFTMPADTGNRSGGIRMPFRVMRGYLGTSMTPFISGAESVTVTAGAGIDGAILVFSFD